MQFITYLPVRYNDGAPVPDAEMQAIKAELYLAFGGASFSGPVEGYWLDQATGQTFQDESYRVEVVTDNGRLQEAREMVIRIGQRLRQEAMYFEVRYFDGVEILWMPKAP